MCPVFPAEVGVGQLAVQRAVWCADYALWYHSLCCWDNTKLLLFPLYTEVPRVKLSGNSGFPGAFILSVRSGFSLHLCLQGTLMRSQSVCLETQMIPWSPQSSTQFSNGTKFIWICRTATVRTQVMFQCSRLLLHFKREPFWTWKKQGKSKSLQRWSKDWKTQNQPCAFSEHQNRLQGNGGTWNNLEKDKTLNTQKR